MLQRACVSASLSGLILLLPGSARAQVVASGFGPEVFPSAQVAGQPIFGGILPATGDLDGDGRADLVACDALDASLLVFLGQAAGGTGPGTPVPLPAALGAFVRPLIGDLDGDGAADVLVHGVLAPQPDLAFLAGLGDGTLAAPVAAGSLPAGAALPLELGDLDDDGVLDLAFANQNATPQVVGWLKGAGDGSFGAAQVLAAVATPKALALGDLDGDGRTDLACLDGLQVAVFHGTGGGAFAAPVHVSSYAALALEIADLDLDGRLDLVHGGPSDVVTVLHGQPDGTLGAPQFVSLGVHWDVRVADVERDGQPDLLAAGFNGQVLGRRMGRDGPIGPPQAWSVPVPNPVAGLVAADFDGDGLTDVAVTGYSTGQLAVATNALGPFIDLGFATASPQGTPHLALSGTPAPGQGVGVQVTLPYFPSLGLLVVGLTAQDLPLLGSTFVPSPDLLLPVTVTGNAFQGAWPAGVPAGTALYLQGVFSLAGGGKALSNAVEIVAE